MPTVLITGANRGLGLEFTKQYLHDHWQVIACARHPEKSKELSELQTSYSENLSVYILDIANASEINTLAKKLQMPIDLLLSNAGIYGGEHQTFGSIDYEAWLETFNVNTLASIRIAEAFVDHLAQSQSKCFVAITSKMGSIADNQSGGYYLYRSSKAALNMAVKSLSVDWRSQGLIALVLHPGWVRTEMGGLEAPLSPEESVRNMRQTISKLRLQDTGKFLDYRGQEIPW